MVLDGDVPSPANPPPGCPFHPRCPNPLKDADCAKYDPPLADKGGGHFVACIKVPSGAGNTAGALPVLGQQPAARREPRA